MSSDYPVYNATGDWSYPTYAEYDPVYQTINPAYLSAVSPSPADSAGYYSSTATTTYHSPSSDAPSPVRQSAWPEYQDPNLFYCPHEGCSSRPFTRKCDLDKHYHNHTKRRRCDLCPMGGAETKDLNRHMWSHHPDEARRRGIPREDAVCEVCGIRGRKDNIKRHKDTKGHW
ncbi:hypothetical protein VTJ83DRAFT_72 [Remersonia thermophila]|uniref:C2H2-type domain-containing protein n=1 Tax=Remersonia thermophila TaxID=72144 RepID=A0ABR4DKB9_9PEZI